MRRHTLPLLALLSLAACAAPRSTEQTAAVPASGPQAVSQLTDQTTIFTCPTCKMEFDRAGECTMCHVALVETQVAYTCPADQKPVAHAGDCPRCDADAVVTKTAAAMPPADAAGR